MSVFGAFEKPLLNEQFGLRCSIGAADEDMVELDGHDTIIIIAASIGVIREVGP
jgi:hypothetical protein